MFNCLNSKQLQPHPDIHTLKMIVRDLRQTDIRPQREDHSLMTAENERRLEERIARFVFGRSA